MAAKHPWWTEYRQRQCNPRKTMTMELIIRKSIFEVLREYANNCSISGVQDMCAPKIGWKERIVRISVFCSMFSMVCYFLYYTWFMTLANPLVVTAETDTYPISEIDFPAVALCNVNRISLKALKVLAKELHPQLAYRNESVEEVQHFLLQAGRLLDFSYTELWGRNAFAFLDIVASRRFNTRVVVDTMKYLAPSCSEMLVRCTWGGENVDCNSIFTVRRTGRGHCCAFNYILDYDSAGSANSTIGVAKRQRVPGSRQGLNVILDPMLDDYAYALSNFRGFDVLLFDPTHFADLTSGRTIHRLSEPNQAEFMELTSIRQVASREVRKYPLKTRQCLFKDELNKEFHNMYSYSACIVHCRIKTVQSLCKCTPYFLPTGKDQGPICTVDDLKCLNKYKEKLLYIYPENVEKTDGLEVEMEDSLYCPQCLPDCELTQHVTKSYTAPLLQLSQKQFFKGRFIEGLNMTNKCVLSIYHAHSDAILDRLDVVAYWFEILSNFGGFGGVLIGFSIFSLVEIIYFLSVRFVMIIRCNYIKYH